MRYLPSLQQGETNRRILIRDASVSALAACLLEETPEAFDELRASLQNDPSLLQWTGLRAGMPKLDIDEACRLWRENALEYLNWQDGDPWEPLPTDPVPSTKPKTPAEVVHENRLEADSSDCRPICLPRLAEKLRSLAIFETRFEETVERAKLNAMAEFAAGAGHEINNPVAVIAGRAQLFLRTETDPKRRHDLALMDAQARRVYEMIADMRLFARPPEPEMSDFDLARLVAETLDDLRGEADQRSIELQQTGATNLVVTADSDQLAVVLRALCKNALESIQKNGTVEVRLQETDAFAVLHVIDDGPGIPEEVRPHLFDPYFSARQAGRGLGLGLSKAWRIVVTNHGGTIDAGRTDDGRTMLSVGLKKLKTG